MPAESLRLGQNQRSLSVVLLCFNDARTIGRCVDRAIMAAERKLSNLQVIVVEDGSSDDSQSVLEALLFKHNCLEIVWHKQNLGYGQSISDGIARARHDYILCADGDGQFDLKDIHLMLRAMNEDCDLVSGNRRPRADQWYRRWCGSIFNLAIRFMLTPGVDDVDCGFKMFRRECALELFPVQSSFAVWIEAMAKARQRRLRCQSIAVRHYPRSSGQSTFFRPRNVVRLLWEVVVLFLRPKQISVALRSTTGDSTTLVRPVRL